jgi:ectoine hydroxylase-related dioxygenase (phytanoyl-CoA dioxygenase family)
MTFNDFRSALMRDGFVHIEQMLDRHAVETLRLGAERCRVARGIAVTKGQWNSSHWSREDAAVRDVLLGPRVGVVAAAALAAESALLLEDTYLVKEGGAAGEVPWHQDQVYYPVRSSDSVVTIWLALDDVALNGGALRYVRGSHRWGRRFVATEFSTGRVYETVALEPIPDLCAAEIVSVPCRAGDAIVHAGTTLHGSGPNHTGARRRALAVSYLAPASRWARTEVPYAHPCGWQWDRPGREFVGLASCPQTRM